MPSLGSFDGQTHHVLPPGTTIFTGIPQTGGALTAHALDSGLNVMVSAAAFWREDRFRSDFISNLQEIPNVWLDSAGFTAAALWAKKGAQPGFGGVYPWTIAQYAELVLDLKPRFWSQSDACCEQEIAADRRAVQWRMEFTVTALEATLAQVYRWQLEAAASGMDPRNLINPPVPVLQGRRPDDYLRSLDALLEVWERWTPWLAAPTIMGVGSVCRRQLHGPEGLIPVLSALNDRLPKGLRLHLFGVKSDALDIVSSLDCVASVDSMAWDARARRVAFDEKKSNSMPHRIAHLDAWIAGQNNRLDAATRQARLFG